MTTDEQLIEAQAGNLQAFSGLVESHQRLVVATALSLTGDVELAHDVAQEAFLLTWKNLPKVRPGCLRAYLTSVTRRLASNARRRRRESYSPVEATDSSAWPDELVSKQEEIAVLRAALASIPKSLRVPLVLYYQGERSIAEVARELEISPDAARQRVHRATRRLRSDLAPQLETALHRSKIAKPRAFAALICLSLPKVPMGAAPSLWWSTLMGKKALAPLALLAGSVAAALALIWSVYGGTVSAQAVSAASEAADARSAPIGEAQAATATSNTPTGGEPGHQEYAPSESDDAVMPSLDELYVQPLVRGRLKMHMPSLDTDGDGDLSLDEVRVQAEGQAGRMARMALDAETRLRSDRERPLSASIEKLLRHALTKAELAKASVIHTPLRISAPHYQNSRNRGLPQDVYAQLYPEEALFFDGDEEEVSVKTKRGQGSKDNMHEELLAIVEPGTPLSELGELVRYKAWSGISDTLSVRCHQVSYGDSGITESSFLLAIHEVGALLAEGPQASSPLDALTAHIEEIFALQEPAICVHMDLVYNDKIGSFESIVELAEDFEILRRLSVAVQ